MWPRNSIYRDLPKGNESPLATAQIFITASLLAAKTEAHPLVIDERIAAYLDGASVEAQWVKDPPADEEAWIPPWVGSGSPGEENGSPLQHSCLGNSTSEEPSRLQTTIAQKSWPWLSN